MFGTRPSLDGNKYESDRNGKLIEPVDLCQRNNSREGKSDDKSTALDLILRCHRFKDTIPELAGSGTQLGTSYPAVCCSWRWNLVA